jgi:hypothetical protein
MRAPPAYLTAADLAEIEVVSRVLVNALWEHRANCEQCNGRLCEQIGKAIDATTEWAELRHLKSRADFLRRAVEA